MTFQEILERRPKDLGPQHEALAKLLMRNREGVTRKQGAASLNVDDRAFRAIVKDCVLSGWLPVIPDRGPTGQNEARYRILGPDEIDAAADYMRETHRRGVTNIRTVHGFRKAFEDFHEAGSLFMPSLPNPEELEGAA